MSTLRERLLARQRPTQRVDVRVASSADTAAAEEALAVARRRVQLLELQSAPPDDTLRKARRALADAQKRRDACYEAVELTALPPADFEELQDAYPASDSDDRAEKRQADSAFMEALFLACAPGDLTEDEWRKLLADGVSQGERLELFNAAFALNATGRAPSASLPKG